MFRFSYCGFNTVIQNNESVLLNLERKNCTLYEPNTDLPTARVARLIWKVVSTPIRPPHLNLPLFRLTDYNPINKFNYHINNGLPASTTTQLANFNSFNIQQTGLYNPNLINTSNQKQPFSTFSTLNAPNLNSLTKNVNPNLVNLNKLKSNTFTRHLSPTAITMTPAHQDLNNLNIFKLNNERLNGQSMSQLQNELDFNEMQTGGQIQKQPPQVNLNVNLNTNNANTANGNNLNSNLNTNTESNTNLNVNHNRNLNLEDLEQNTFKAFNNSQLMLNQLNSTLSSNTTVASLLEIN